MENNQLLFFQLVLITVTRDGGKKERDRGLQGQRGENTQILFASKHVGN